MEIQMLESLKSNCGWLTIVGYALQVIKLFITQGAVLEPSKMDQFSAQSVSWLLFPLLPLSLSSQSFSNKLSLDPFMDSFSFTRLPSFLSFSNKLVFQYKQNLVWFSHQKDSMSSLMLPFIYI